MEHTYQEIHRQPQSFREALTVLEDAKANLVHLFRESIDGVIFTGCGTSYNLSLSAACIFQTITHIPSRGIPSSEIFLFPDSIFVSGQKYLLIAISRSGETSETVKALDFFAHNYSGKTIGITCEGSSALVQKASFPLVFPFAHEESVVMTQSFSTMLLGVIFLALALQRKEEDLSFLPEYIARKLPQEEPTVKSLAEKLHFEKFIFLGNGPYYGIAWEGSLKLKEMSLTPTETFHFLEFRHGPKSIVDEKTLIVALTSQKAFSYEQKLLQEMADLGATIFH
ncbi:MAG: SIS domain-containing protein, partial [Candidatus Caldatribacteriaceae bacterium]